MILRRNQETLDLTGGEEEDKKEDKEEEEKEEEEVEVEEGAEGGGGQMRLAIWHSCAQCSTFACVGRHLARCRRGWRQTGAFDGGALRADARGKSWTKRETRGTRCGCSSATVGREARAKVPEAFVLAAAQGGGEVGGGSRL